MEDGLGQYDSLKSEIDYFLNAILNNNEEKKEHVKDESEIEEKLAKEIEDKSKKIMDAELLPNSPQNTAYLMNKENYDELIQVYKPKVATLESSFNKLGFPLYIFDFKNNSLIYYFKGIYSIQGDFTKTSDGSSVFFYFAKALLDKKYIDEINNLYR